LREYTVRESARAKRVIIRISSRDGLVVVVPVGFDRGLIPALLERKRDWVERKGEELEEQRRSTETGPPGVLPASLALRSLGEEWAVEYLPGKSPRVTAVELPGGRLKVSGRAEDAGACEAAVRLWLRRKAHRDLVPWLEELAGANGFAAGRVSVRSQKSRWASCSAANHVSLNLKLLFLPEELVRYVLLHELCHTVHHDHSPEFWSLLERHQPDCASRRKEIRAAWKYVPAWLDE
jgi:predicted metal-dependent hydrolase